MSRSVLLIGGSGFVSGHLARMALEAENDVTILTRGTKTLPPGATHLRADREDRAAFLKAIESANRKWDIVVDSIGYHKVDAEQDIAVFRERAEHFVFISTDFIVNHEARTYPQIERGDFRGNSPYGAEKLECEKVFANADAGSMRWTIVRPGHIYGPGSALGCLPLHARDANLIAKMRRGEPLRLAGGGIYLQQPIFVRDLAKIILSAADNEKTHRQIYFVGGAEIAESRRYYEIIAEHLGVPVDIREESIEKCLRDDPSMGRFFAHRIYSHDKLRADGLSVPSTSLHEGLRQHVASLQA